MYLVSGAGQVPRYYCLRVGAGGRTIGKPRQRTVALRMSRLLRSISNARARLAGLGLQKMA